MWQAAGQHCIDLEELKETHTPMVTHAPSSSLYSPTFTSPRYNHVFSKAFLCLTDGWRGTRSHLSLNGIQLPLSVYCIFNNVSPGDGYRKKLCFGAGVQMIVAWNRGASSLGWLGLRGLTSSPRLSENGAKLSLPFSLHRTKREDRIL